MGVSKNNVTPKSSISIGFSIINHPFWGTPIFGNTQMLPISLLFLISQGSVCPTVEHGMLNGLSPQALAFNTKILKEVPRKNMSTTAGHRSTKVISALPSSTCIIEKHHKGCFLYETSAICSAFFRKNAAGT